MRTFKRLNVVKVTNDEQKAARLLADGFVEVTADRKASAKKTRSKKTIEADGGENDGEPGEAENPAGNNGQ